jgi:hypothetical protein
MSFRSTSECYQATLRPSLEELQEQARRQHPKTPNNTASFREVCVPYSVFRTGQRPVVWGVRTLQTPSVFRFSQPLDASLRPEPTGLVSCQIRSWGSSSSELLPPVQVPAVSSRQPLMPLREPLCLVATPPLRAIQRERRNTRVTLTVTSQAKRPRLQGFAPHENSTLSTGCLGTMKSRCSLELLPLQGLLPLTAAPEISLGTPLLRLPCLAPKRQTAAHFRG